MAVDGPSALVKTSNFAVLVLLAVCAGCRAGKGIAVTLTLTRYKRKEQLFFIAYALYMTYFMLSTSFYARDLVKLGGMVTAACIGLLFLRELQVRRYSKKAMFILMFSAALAFLLYVRGNGGSMCLLLFVYCGRNIRFDRIARFTVLVGSLVLALVILSAYLGIIQNYVGLRDGHYRQYLGFRYALYPACYMFNITALILYLRKGKIHWGQLLALLLVNVWIYWKTDARLSFFLTTLLLAASCVLKRWPNFLARRRFLCRLMAGSFVLCAILSIALTLAYNGASPRFVSLDAALGGRLHLGQDSLKLYGVSLLGKKIEWVGSGLDAMGDQVAGRYLYVDNLYIQIMQQYGIAFFVVYVGFFTLVGRLAWKNKDYYLLSAVAVLAARGIIDDLSMLLYYNTYWFIVGTMLLNTIRKKRASRAALAAVGGQRSTL